MRCQHANSNLPWMLYTVHLAINSIQLVTIISLNPSLKGNKCSVSFFSWVCLSIFFPPPCFPSPFLATIHPFSLCFCITSPALHSHLIHRGPGGELKQVLNTTANPLIHPPIADCRARLCHGNTHFPAFMCCAFPWMFLVFNCIRL